MIDESKTIVMRNGRAADERNFKPNQRGTECEKLQRALLTYQAKHVFSTVLMYGLMTTGGQRGNQGFVK